MNINAKTIVKILKAGIAAATVTAAVVAQAKSSDSSEHGVWLGVSAKANIDTNGLFNVTLSEDNRFGEKHLDEVHAAIAVGYKPFDWLTIAPRYHQVYSRKNKTGASKPGGGYVDHRWEREDRVGFDVTPSWTLGGWKFSDRNRIVWRDFEDDRGFWRYRNRIQVAAPWKWTEYKINPYASFELFLDDGKPSKNVRKNDKFDQWRFIVGTTAKLSKNATLNTYSLLQEKKDTGDHDWRPNHVIGVNLGFSF